MNSDIRLQISFRDNRKRKKLQKRLGADGVLALVDLWLGVATSRPEGILRGWDAVDIALEANYPGDPKEFVDALVDVGFLDEMSDCYKLHNWCILQKWVVSAPDRSESARKKILLRWALKGLPKKEQDDFKTWFYSEYQFNKEDNTASILAVYKQYTEVNTPSPYPYPSPSPSPLPKDIYGEFSNVLLSKYEFEKLKKKFHDYEEKIESLSSYLQSKGKKYKDHYATILNWARRDGDDGTAGRQREWID